MNRKTTYGQALAELVENAPPAKSTNRAELEARLAEISSSLKGPMENVERLMLCEERSSIRKALTALA